MAMVAGANDFDLQSLSAGNVPATSPYPSQDVIITPLELPIQPRTPPPAQPDGGAESEGTAPRPFLEEDRGEAEQPLAPMPERTVSIDLTPLSAKSCDNAREFHQPEETIIIFDWDDTLCPSTTCMRDHGLQVLGARPEGELKALLDEHAEQVQAVLECAQALAGKVVIVTNAETGWVELSCAAWMPSLADTLAQCEVASARSKWEPHGVQSPAGWKAKEFEAVIDRFYSQNDRRAWKNMVSIGDAPHEREALCRVARLAPFNGRQCRSKSVKFVLRPSVIQLTRELATLHENLRDVIFHDGDLDLQFSG